MAGGAPRPFKLHVSDELLNQTKKKLDSARFPDDIADGWEDGTPSSEVRRLRDYWLGSYDWRSEETRINEELPQYKQTIDVTDWGSLDLHFVHKKSNRPGALPLIFIHGWPGHFLEVRKILPQLTEPETPDLQAFHVIAPSIPGFGFSDNPDRPGFGYPQIAEAFNNLMRSLGYSNYVAQGGDIGSFISIRLGQKYPESCRAVLVNMLVANPPTLLQSPISWLKWVTFPNLFYSKMEMENLARTAWFFKGEVGYQAIQRTKPQSLSYGLWDSPISLLAWIREKMETWSDSYPWTEHEIVTWVMIYWVSQVTGGLRIYKYGNVQDITSGYVSVPFGVISFPKELFLAPKDWARQCGNLKYYRVHEHGGHFAAIETPDELVQDIREFFQDNAGI